MAELARLADCSFTYRNTREPVLKSVNITLNTGDRILLAGKSGSGKSTLLAMLAGLVPEYIPGRIEGTAAYSYTNKAFVMQNPEAQIITPSVFEEAAFALENRAVAPRAIEARVTTVLGLAGLLTKSERHPLTLSGGECQRVSLAAALAQQADVLFMDEPLSYLDDASSRDLVALLEQENTHSTAVIVEHRLDLFTRYCNRFFRIEDRMLIECGREDLLREHCVYSAGWSDTGKKRAGSAGLGQYFDQASYQVANTNDSTTVNTSAKRNSGVIPVAPVLSVRTMRHSFGERAVLEDVSFEVNAGEVVVLMGGSGSGKTTILNKITKTLAVKRGEVFVNGRDVAAMSAGALYMECFLVPQNPEHMFIANTVSKEISYSNMEAVKYLERFSLKDKAERHPFSLSEGEKRRLNLCSALALDRKLIMFDEPTYGLDYESVEKIIDDIVELKRSGKAILVVTHDANFAKAVGDRLLVLSGGRLCAATVDQETERVTRSCDNAHADSEDAGIQQSNTKTISAGTKKNSGCSNFNPLAVLAGTITMLIPVLIAFDVVSPLAFAGLGLFMYAVAGLKKPFSYARAVLLLSGFALSLVFVNLVVPGKGSASIYRSVAIFTRSMSLIAISVGFLYVVDPYDAVRALMQNLGMAPRVGYALFAGWNTIPLFMRDTLIQKKSAQMRFGKRKVPLEARFTGAAILLSQAIRHGERAALSMAVRALDAVPLRMRGNKRYYDRTYVKMVPWRFRDTLYCLVIAVAAAVALFLCIKLGWFRFELG